MTWHVPHRARIAAASLVLERETLDVESALRAAHPMQIAGCLIDVDTQGWRSARHRIRQCGGTQSSPFHRRTR
jgi:hypothetical protein